jgi:hypothetical protein
MATVACPFCYHSIRQSRLAFQCLGRGVPGNSARCTRKTDPVRVRHTGVSDPMLPVFTVQSRNPLGVGTEAACPHCTGKTNVRACPVCHTPLSMAFVESSSPLIGMIGGKGAGKTVYTAVLHHELHTNVRRRFDADIRLTGGQQGGRGSARLWLETNEEQLFKDGKLFDQTKAAPGGIRAPVVIEWRQPRRRLGVQEVHDTTVLSFYDAAGEDLTNLDRVRDQAYLGVAGGLILLLDPWQLPGARDRIDVPANVVREAAPPLDVLTLITEMLRQEHKVKTKHKVPIPLAVVFAKMDAFFPVLGPNHPLRRPVTAVGGYDDAAGEDIHEHVRVLLHDYGADDIDSLLLANYKTFRYFAVSALGAAPDYAAGVVDGAGVRPFRVEEPLLWLLQRLGVFGGGW